MEGLAYGRYAGLIAGRLSLFFFRLLALMNAFPLLFLSNATLRGLLIQHGRNFALAQFAFPYQPNRSFRYAFAIVVFSLDVMACAVPLLTRKKYFSARTDVVERVCAWVFLCERYVLLPISCTICGNWLVFGRFTLFAAVFCVFRLAVDLTNELLMHHLLNGGRFNMILKDSTHVVYVIDFAAFFLSIGVQNLTLAMFAQFFSCLLLVALYIRQAFIFGDYVIDYYYYFIAAFFLGGAGFNFVISLYKSLNFYFLAIGAIWSIFCGLAFMIGRNFFIRKRLIRVFNLMQYVHAMGNSIANRLIRFSTANNAEVESTDVYEELVRSTYNKYSLQYYTLISQFISANSLYYRDLQGYKAFQRFSITDDEQESKNYYSVQQCIDFLGQQKITCDDIVGVVLYLMKIGNKCRSIVEIQQYAKLFKILALPTDIKLSSDPNVYFYLCKRYLEIHILQFVVLLLLIKPYKYMGNSLFFILTKHSNYLAGQIANQQPDAPFEITINEPVFINDDIKLIFNKHLSVNKNYQIQLFTKYDMQKMLNKAKLLQQFAKVFYGVCPDNYPIDQHLSNMMLVWRLARYLLGYRRDVYCVELYLGMVVKLRYHFSFMFNKYFAVNSLYRCHIEARAIMNYLLLKQAFSHVKYSFSDNYLLCLAVSAKVYEYNTEISANIEHQTYLWQQYPSQTLAQRYFQVSQEDYNFYVMFYRFFYDLFDDTVEQKFFLGKPGDVSQTLYFVRGVVLHFDQQLNILIRLGDVFNQQFNFNNDEYANDYIVVSFRKCFAYVLTAYQEETSYMFVPTFYSANHSLLVKQYVTQAQKAMVLLNRNIYLFECYFSGIKYGMIKQRSIQRYCVLRAAECVRHVYSLFDHLMNLHHLDQNNLKTIRFIEASKMYLHLNSLEEFLRIYKISSPNGDCLEGRELTVALNSIRGYFGGACDRNYQLSSYKHLVSAYSTEKPCVILLQGVDTDIKYNAEQTILRSVQKWFLQRHDFVSLLRGPALAYYSQYGPNFAYDKLYPLNNMSYSYNIVLSRVLSDTNRSGKVFALCLVACLLVIYILIAQYKIGGMQALNLLLSMAEMIVSNGDLWDVLFYSDLVYLINGCISVSIIWQYSYTLLTGLTRMALDKLILHYNQMMEGINRSLETQLSYFNQLYVRIKGVILYAITYMVESAYTQNYVFNVKGRTTTAIYFSDLLSAFGKCFYETRILPSENTIKNDVIRMQTGRFQHSAYKIATKVLNTVIDGIPQLFSTSMDYIVKVPRNQFADMLSLQQFKNGSYLQQILEEVNLYNTTKSSYLRYRITDPNILLREIEYPALEDISFGAGLNTTYFLSTVSINMVNKQQKNSVIARYSLQYLSIDKMQYYYHYDALLEDWKNLDILFFIIIVSIVLICAALIIVQMHFIKQLSCKIALALDRDPGNSISTHSKACYRKSRILPFLCVIGLMISLIISQAFYNRIIVTDSQKQQVLAQQMTYNIDKLFKMHIDQLHSSLMYQLYGTVEHLKIHELTNSQLSDYLSKQCIIDFSMDLCITLDEKLKEQEKQQIANMASTLMFLAPSDEMPVTLSYMEKMRYHFGCKEREYLRMPFYYKMRELTGIIDAKLGADCQPMLSIAELHSSKYYTHHLQQASKAVEEAVSKMSYEQFNELYKKGTLFGSYEGVFQAIQRLSDTRLLLDTFAHAIEQEAFIFSHQNQNNFHISNNLLIALIIFEISLLYKLPRFKGQHILKVVCLFFIIVQVVIQLAHGLYYKNQTNLVPFIAGEIASFQYANRLEYLYNSTLYSGYLGDTLHFAYNDLLFSGITVRNSNKPQSIYQKYSFQALSGSKYAIFNETSVNSTKLEMLQSLVIGSFIDESHESKLLLVLGAEYQELSARTRHNFYLIDFEYHESNYLFTLIQLAASLGVVVCAGTLVLRAFDKKDCVANAKIWAPAKIEVNLRRCLDKLESFDPILVNNIKTTNKFLPEADRALMCQTKYLLEKTPQTLAKAPPDFVYVTIHNVNGKIEIIKAKETIVAENHLCDECKMLAANSAALKTSESSMFARRLAMDFHLPFVCAYLILLLMGLVILFSRYSVTKNIEILKQTHSFLYALEKLYNAFNHFYAAKLFQTLSTRALLSTRLHAEYLNFNNLIGELSIQHLLSEVLGLQIDDIYGLMRMIVCALAYKEYDGFSIQNFGGDDFTQIIELFSQIRARAKMFVADNGAFSTYLRERIGLNIVNVWSVCAIALLQFSIFRFAYFSLQRRLIRYNAFIGVRRAQGLQYKFDDTSDRFVSGSEY